MKVSQLFVYPVKSLRGFAVDQAELTPLGLKYDRHWMLINDKNQFVTQRKLPSMVLIKTRINDGYLYLSKTGMPEIKVQIESNDNQNKHLIASVWGDQCNVVDEGDDVAQWLTEAIESPKSFRLVRMAAEHSRPQSNPERFGADNTTQFADTVAYLICNQNSLDRLNKELAENKIRASLMEQFRPNIVLSDDKQSSHSLAPFAEHQAIEFVHKDYSFVSHDACQRCIVPTINIETSEKHPQQEPYKTLVKINPMPDNPKAPAFGQNATLKKTSNGQIINLNDYIESVF